MSSSDPAMSEGLRRVLARLDPRVRQVANLTRLSAGATNETWSLEAVRDAGVEAQDFAVDSEHLILRRSAVGRGSGVLSLQAEAHVLTAVHGCNVPVPEVRYVLTPEDGLGEGFLMQRIAGATLPGKILRDPALASVRPRLASQLGAIAAAIHAVELSRLPELPLFDAEGQLQHLHSQYQEQETPRPVFDLAFRWLREHLPPAVTPMFVHGDYRHGNLIIGAQGVHAVLDWELAHVGDPAEDLAWMCIPPWRFGELDHPVGGFGQRDDLLAAYERASGRSIDAARLTWWDVLGSLRWGIMCADMPKWLRSGRDRSIERATIARRASESELDLLRILSPRSQRTPR
ncbi:MAG TPA: phosphotransferase family protein [Steroidobacteraceae bacterium]|nr:phosphotransferase family protein [Steroidobacteraceae bacterium]